MEPVAETLVMYTRPSDKGGLEWSWVEDQLRAAGTYWVLARGDGHPHPRPVWGVWADGKVQLSLGSPVVNRQLRADPVVTVHLDSGTDVVIVEGRVTGTSEESSLVSMYDAKYDWKYDVAEYGPFTTVTAERVLAWRSAGWAGRDGFQQTGRWRFS